jgi:hypothetical protein
MKKSYLLIFGLLILYGISLARLSNNEALTVTSGSGSVRAAGLPTATQVIPTQTQSPTQTPTQLPTRTPAPLPTQTTTSVPTEVPLLASVATPTETISEKLKTHIVFYLIVPEKGRTDACGKITVMPIISKRLRTGDKLQDVQIALNMLFGIKQKIYASWYNALWGTDLNIQTFEYRKENDYAVINFGGYFPNTTISACDKHGIREQIWNTFFHYGFREKTFKVNGHFLIDMLGGH